MKKLFAIMALALMSLGFMVRPIAAAELPIEETETVEVVEETETETETPIYEEEVADFTAELNETLAAIFAYIGGFSGLAALGAFVLRFIKDRAIMKGVRDQMTALGNNSNASITTINSLVDVVNKYSAKEEMLEKMVISLISTSNLDPKVKQQVIEGLKNDTLKATDIINMSLEQVAAEVQTNEAIQNQINEQTTSLLKKLAQKDNE